MDPVTSAVIFIVVSTVLNVSAKQFLANMPMTMLALGIVIANYVQFGYFSGLWPFTAAGAIYAAAVVGVILFAGILALRDARKDSNEGND